MLRKAASESGKDWDKLLPYLLFAYRGAAGLDRVFVIRVAVRKGSTLTPGCAQGGMGGGLTEQ